MNNLTLEEAILKVLKDGRERTPYEVFLACDEHWPITSVRYRMTTMTDNDILVKTNNKRKGQYHYLTYTWKLKD